MKSQLCDRHEGPWMGGDEATCPVCSLQREAERLRAHVTTLSEQIVSLIAQGNERLRERDEARLQRDAAFAGQLKLQQEHANLHGRYLRLVAERDEVRAELDAERARLITRVQALVALLREVEWQGGSGTVEVPCCPCCYGHGAGPFTGHAPDCRLRAALEGRDG